MCQVLEETFENGQKSNTKLVISRPESDRVTQLDIWRVRGEGLGGWVDGWVARWMPQSGDKGVGMVRIGPHPPPGQIITTDVLTEIWWRAGGQHTSATILPGEVWWRGLPPPPLPLPFPTHPRQALEEVYWGLVAR